MCSLFSTLAYRWRTPSSMVISISCQNQVVTVDIVTNHLDFEGVKVLELDKIYET